MADTTAPPPPPAPSTDVQIKKDPPSPPTPSAIKVGNRWQLKESEDKEKWKFDPSVAKTANIRSLDWFKAAGFQSSSDGAEGVFFVGWPDNAVTVVKGSMTVMADLFVNELAKLANIPVPDMKIARYSIDTEFHLISRTLNELDQLKKRKR